LHLILRHEGVYPRIAGKAEIVPREACGFHHAFNGKIVKGIKAYKAADGSDVILLCGDELAF
jgi:hypothetical protein